MVVYGWFLAAAHAAYYLNAEENRHDRPADHKTLYFSVHNPTHLNLSPLIS